MNYNELMQKAGKRINPSVYYYNAENEIIEIGYDDIIQAKPFFNASLVGTIMTGFSLEIKKSIPNSAIYFKNIVTYDGISAEKDYGPFYLKETPQYNADDKTYTCQLYDSFLPTMVEYKPIQIEYPCSVNNYFKQLCLECGFTTDIESLPNGDKMLDHDIYEEIDFTYRDVFNDIGQATATLFACNNKNIYKCVLGTEEDIVINDDILKNQNIEMGVHYGPINSIVLSRGGDADSIYKRDESLTEWNEFKISENQLMNDNNRDEYLDAIYNELYGIEFDIFDLSLVGYGGFEPLQKIKIITGEKEFNSYVFNNEEIFTQGYEESIYTELPEESETDYKASDTTDKRIRQTMVLANKQEQYIQQLVKDMYEEDGIVNENFTEIYSNLLNIIMSVQNSGGNNLIKNSVGFAGTTEWDLTYDNEDTSTINTQSNVELLENGISGGAFLINGVKISQDIVVSLNNDYCFSCKVSKKPYGTGYVKIYNPGVEAQVWIKEFSAIESLNYEEIKFDGIKINGNTLRVEIYGQEGTNLVVTDSMLNRGDLSSIWTQANGEILNTQVNITSNGMLVKSVQFDENGQYVTINPLEFAGYAKKNGVQTRVFTVNGDTTIVNKFRSEEEIAMKPIKIVPIIGTSNDGWAFVGDSGGANNG